MLSTTEASLLDRLFGHTLYAIFRSAASFLPTDLVATLGTHLRNQVRLPREVHVEPTAIASATEVTPNASVNYISGTTAIDTIAVSSSQAVGLVWTVIPTGVFTWTTSDNIALAGTAVVSKVLQFVYNPSTAKWYPSYIA